MRYSQAPGPLHKRVQQGYTTGARSLASRSVTSLARTRVTPNALTAAGVTLCLAAAVLVPFEDRNHLLYDWLGAFVFVVTDKSTVDQRAVTAGQHVGDDVVIQKGISPGDRVVTEGQLRLEQGTRVQQQTAGGATPSDNGGNGRGRGGRGGGRGQGRRGGQS